MDSAIISKFTVLEEWLEVLAKKTEGSVGRIITLNFPCFDNIAWLRSTDMEKQELLISHLKESVYMLKHTRILLIAS